MVGALKWQSMTSMNTCQKIPKIHGKVVTVKGFILYLTTDLIRSAFKKHMCFFVLFFSSSSLILAKIFKKCFLVLFLDKNVLFSVEWLIFPGKQHFWRFWAQKKLHFFQSLVFCTNFFKKNFLPCFALHKVYSYCTTVHIYLLICTTVHMYLWIW